MVTKAELVTLKYFCAIIRPKIKMKKPSWQESGVEPDYRFSMANERTFLAWIRTALAVLAGGILLEQLATRLQPLGVLSLIAVLLAVLATVLSGGAYLRWRANEIAMRHAAPLPASAAIPLLAAGLMVVGALSAALLLGKWRPGSETPACSLNVPRLRGAGLQ